MIIVSQNKGIVTERIELSIEDSTIDDKKKIMLESENGKLYVLGYYETEERAKEVLQEIITRYKNWENFKVGQPTGLCLPVYEMPKE